MQLRSHLRRRQRGISLIEVLVAILVLGVGLLGVAGLQLTALRSSQSAELRSQASLLAYDIIERMRMDRAAALAGDYDTCADHDECAAWQDSVAAILGDGATGTVVRNDGRVEVRIQWNDSRGSIRSASGASGSSSVTFTYSTEL